MYIDGFGRISFRFVNNSIAKNTKSIPISLCGAGSAVPREELDLVLLFLHHCLTIRGWAAVTLCYGLAICHVFIKWNAHFKTLLLVNTCQSGDTT